MEYEVQRVPITPLSSHSLAHYQCLEPEWPICYSQWIYTDSSLIHSYTTVHSWQCTFCSLDKCIMTCIQPYNIMKTIFIALKIVCALHRHPSRPTDSWQPLISLLSYSYIAFPFPEYHMIRVIECIAFSNWLILLSSRYLRYPPPSFHDLVGHFFLAINNIQ